MPFTLTHPDFNDRHRVLCDTIVTLLSELRLTRLVLETTLELLIERDASCRQKDAEHCDALAC